MTYCKYYYFLMPKDGPEYEATYKAGTAAPYSGICYCKACGGSKLLIAHRCCPAQGPTGGGWL
jgi:hypothetical protein